MCKIMPMNTITVPVGVGRTDLCKLLEKVEAGARVVLTSHGHQLPGAGSQSLAAHPPFQCPPQSQRQETDQYVCLDSPVLVMKNRPQTQVALGVAERRLGLLQLQIPLPHFSRIRFGAVGAFCNAQLTGLGAEARHGQQAGGSFPRNLLTTPWDQSVQEAVQTQTAPE